MKVRVFAQVSVKCNGPATAVTAFTQDDIISDLLAFVREADGVEIVKLKTHDHEDTVLSLPSSGEEVAKGVTAQQMINIIKHKGQGQVPGLTSSNYKFIHKSSSEGRMRMSEFSFTLAGVVDSAVVSKWLFLSGTALQDNVVWRLDLHSGVDMMMAADGINTDDPLYRASRRQERVRARREQANADRLFALQVAAEAGDDPDGKKADSLLDKVKDIVKKLAAGG